MYLIAKKVVTLNTQYIIDMAASGIVNFLWLT